MNTTPSSLPILLALALLMRTGQGYRVTVDLNTYTSTELTFAAQQWPRRINGTWTLANNSGWNGSATLPTDEEWRATLAAVGGQQFSEQMWNCSATDDAAWNCSGISKYGPHSADECTIVRRLAPHGELAGAFCYHETGSKPHTMLSRVEITAASRSCGGCGIIGHTRLYGGPFKAMVDGVLTHPKLLGVAIWAPEFGGRIVFRPRKRMSSYFLLKRGVQIPYPFHENKTPHSDSANPVSLKPIFCPQLLEPRWRWNCRCPRWSGRTR